MPLGTAYITICAICLECERIDDTRDKNKNHIVETPKPSIEVKINKDLIILKKRKFI